MAAVIHKGYKTELRPNDKQRSLFVRYCGTARFVYNWALADRIERHKAGLKTTQYEQCRRFNALKDAEFPWIRETAYVVMQEAFADLDTAYQNFFRRVKQGAEKKGFPKFKSRKDGIGSFRVRGSIHVEASRIKLPRIGWLRLKEKDYLPVDGVTILSATVSERAGRWFVSVQVEQEALDYPAPTAQPLGVDLGLKSLAVCSNGRTFDNPAALRRHEAQLARLQRELCRRQKGSKNRDKTKQKIARLHYRIASIRAHATHQVSDYVTAKVRPVAVVVEDLNVVGMAQNHCLAKSVMDAGMSEVRRQIEYKADWRGIDVVAADRWYPSSKTCSACGNVKPMLRLSARQYVCEACGVVMDRDLNAARNLAALAEGANGPGLPVELGCSNASL